MKLSVKIDLATRGNLSENSEFVRVSKGLTKEIGAKHEQLQL
jgi:hypothetical protein